MKVIGRLPGEQSCLSLLRAVLDRAFKGWRGLTMTSDLTRFGTCRISGASCSSHRPSSIASGTGEADVGEVAVTEAGTAASWEQDGACVRAVWTRPETPPCSNAEPPLLLASP